MKWNQTSMCLVWAWYWWSFVSVMADWLSKKRVVGLSLPGKTWERREQSQSTYFATWVMATYSLSVVESSVWKSGSVRFLDLDQVQPQLQPVQTAPTTSKNRTELYTTGSNQSGCCNPTDLNRFYTRLVSTTQDQLGTESQVVIQVLNYVH